MCHNTGRSYKTKAKQKLQKQSKAKVTKTDTKTTNQIYFSDSAHEYFAVPFTFANKE